MTFFMSVVLGLILALQVSCHKSPWDEPLSAGDKVETPREIVITIPGITGTPLFESKTPQSHKSHQVWPPQMLSLDGDFATLSCDQNGRPLKKLSPGRPFEDFYGDFAERLHHEGFRAIPFGYDWRVGVDAAAWELHQLIEKLSTSPNHLHKSVKPSISLVAHSMGGLVILNYLNRFGPSKIKRVVTLGTPFLGAPAALKTLEKGDFVDGILGYFLRPSFVDLFRNHRSWYELLPTRGYFELVSPNYITGPSQKPIRGFEQTALFIKSRPWANHRLVDELANGLTVNQKLKLLKEVDGYFIIGEQQATTGALRCDRNPPADCTPLVANGDGAVVLQSAHMGGRLAEIRPGRLYFIAEHHGKLFTNPVILTQVLNILRGNPRPIAPLSGKPNPQSCCL